jgi:hypothetical protein
MIAAVRRSAIVKLNADPATGSGETGDILLRRVGEFTKNLNRGGSVGDGR